MQNQIAQMLMGQLKMRNPQAFQQVNQLIKNNGNPQEFLKQIMGNYTPEQMKQFRQFANNFGYSEETLDKYGINAK